jgi:hypothetical protein
LQLKHTAESVTLVLDFATSPVESFVEALQQFSVRKEILHVVAFFENSLKAVQHKLDVSAI